MRHPTFQSACIRNLVLPMKQDSCIWMPNCIQALPPNSLFRLRWTACNTSAATPNSEASRLCIRKYFEVVQRCVWTQPTQDFSFYNFSSWCKGCLVLGSNAPQISHDTALVCWNLRVKDAKKKTTYPHISTVILGTNERSNTLWQQAFSRRQATASRA